MGLRVWRTFVFAIGSEQSPSTSDEHGGSLLLFSRPRFSFSLNNQSFTRGYQGVALYYVVYSRLWLSAKIPEPRAWHSPQMCGRLATQAWDSPPRVISSPLPIYHVSLNHWRFYILLWWNLLERGAGFSRWFSHFYGNLSIELYDELVECTKRQRALWRSHRPMINPAVNIWRWHCLNEATQAISSVLAIDLPEVQISRHKAMWFQCMCPVTIGLSEAH